MTIDELQISNQVHRELIEKLKRFIYECDAQIYHNEVEIGKQLEQMSTAEGCTLCLGECEIDGNNKGAK